ncbi:MAG: hypothetical protein KAV82_10500, partial [Phycisphaerae bacterium]|nr:hypothetical protein [Phycisphaerae bacterium]
VSWEVDAVIIKALEKEPAARYQSVPDLAGDLGGWLKGKPVSAVPNTAWYIFGKWLRSHKLLVAVGTCLVAAMIGLAVFAVGKSIESEKARVAGHVKNVLMGCWQADRDDPLNASALLWSEYRKQQPPDLRTEYALWEFYRRYPCVYAVNAGPLLDVECSPTGKWLVTTTLDGALKVFDSATGLGVQRIDKDAACAWCLKFAPDGKRIYTGGMDGKIRVWGFAEQTGRLDDTPLVTLDATGTRVNCIAVSPDGQWLAAGMGEVDSGVDKKRCDITDAKVCLWRVAHSEYEFLRRIDHPCKVHGLAFSADNTLLASGTTAHGGHGSVRVWDTRSGELLHERAFGQHCRALRFSKDGSCLFIGGTHLLRWAFNTEAVEPLESDSRWGVRSIDLLELGANRSVIAVAAGDGRVRLYDAESRDRLRIQGYHDAEQTHVDVCFSPNGETFASVSRDGLKVWELPPAKSILFKRRLQEVPYITLSEDGSRIAAVSYHQDKTWAIDVWHRNPTSNLNRTPGKQRWEAQAIDPLPQPFGTPALSGDGCGLAFSDGVGEFVATRCLYVLDNDRPIMPKIMFPSDWGRVNWLLWHGSDANTLLLACSDGPMRAWRRQHGTTGRKSQFEPCFDGFAGQCTYVATSRDGKWLAACSEWDRSTGQGRVVLWRSTGLDLHSHAFENAYTLRSEFGTGGCTWRVALVKAENGDLLLATAGNRKDVRLWDGGSGELVARLAGHRDSIFGCFALNDRMLVTASRDGTVRVWDVWQREEVCVLYSRQGVTPSISVCNGRIAIADNNTVTIADTRRIQSYLDGNRGFEHQRPADHR